METIQLKVQEKAVNFKFENVETEIDLEFNEVIVACFTVTQSGDKWMVNLINFVLDDIYYEDKEIDSDTYNYAREKFNYITRNTRYPISSDKVDTYFQEFQRAGRKILKYKSDASKVEPQTAQEEPKLKAAGKPRVAGSLEEQIWDIVHQSFETEESQEVITHIIKQKLDAWGIVPNQTELVIKEADKEPKNVGAQHKQFGEIMQCIKAGVNVALVGPAGSGKTTAVREVAKALDLEFYSKSVSAQTGIHEFFGYQDANGKYVRTIFREAFENGGVFLLDEFDAGNPNVLAALNQATANGQCSFADGMVKKHKDFIVVMAGNTFGFGATTEYVGRNKIDAATLDRFAFIDFQYDEEKVMDLIIYKGLEKTEVEMLKAAI